MGKHSDKYSAWCRGDGAATENPSASPFVGALRAAAETSDALDCR